MLLKQMHNIVILWIKAAIYWESPAFHAGTDNYGLLSDDYNLLKNTCEVVIRKRASLTECQDRQIGQATS